MYVCVFTFAFFIFMYIKNVVIVVLVVVVVGFVDFFLHTWFYFCSCYLISAFALLAYTSISCAHDLDLLMLIFTQTRIFTHTYTNAYMCTTTKVSGGLCMRETLAPKLTNTLHNHNCHMVLLVDLPFLLFSSPTLVKQIFPYDLVSAYVLKY